MDSQNTTNTTNTTNIINTPIPVLHPPELFAIVHPDIYRCSTIDYTNRTFLRTLNLKTLLCLSIEKPSKHLRAICENENIKLVHVGVWRNSSYNSNAAGIFAGERESGGLGGYAGFGGVAWREAICEALEVLRKDCRPVLVVESGSVTGESKVRQGNDAVGVFCGIIRRLQGWNYTSIVLEYRSFAGAGQRYSTEEVIEGVELEKFEIREEVLVGLGCPEGVRRRVGSERREVGECVSGKEEESS